MGRVVEEAEDSQMTSSHSKPSSVPDLNLDSWVEVLNLYVYVEWELAA